MRDIIFHSNSLNALNERGTSVALYDYSLYSKKYLNLNPIILYDLNFESRV